MEKFIKAISVSGLYRFPTKELGSALVGSNPAIVDR